MIIKIEKTDKALSAVGGLVIFKSLFDRLTPHMNIENALPKLKRDSLSNFNKLKNLTMAFIAGADCLDDGVPQQATRKMGEGPRNRPTGAGFKSP